MNAHHHLLVIILVCFMGATWSQRPIQAQPGETMQENPGRLFIQARPPRVNHGVGHRGQLTVPQSFAGLRTSPDIYRWMIGLYGGTAITRMGVTVAEASDPSLDRRVPCCTGHIIETRLARNCTQNGGGCCAKEQTNYPGSAAGGIGLINPRKLKSKSREQQSWGNCWQCYESYSVCLVGN